MRPKKDFDYQYLHQAAKRLLLLDGFGALLSSFLLGVVLLHFQEFFGIPVRVLCVLSLIPLALVGYDLYCYYRVNRRLGLALKILAILNLAYCILSLVLGYHHREVLSGWAWCYLIVEITIVMVIANIEWKLGEKL